MKKYEVQIQDSKSNKPYAKIKYYNNELHRDIQLYLCSKVDPEMEGERWAQALYDQHIQLFFIYGLGFGYHIKALLKRLNKHQKVYILETNVEVQDQLKPYMCLTKEEVSSIHILCTEQLEEAGAFIQGFLKQIKNDQFVIEFHPSSAQIMPNHFQKLKDTLKNYKITVNSIYKFEDEVITNYKAHQKESYKNIAQLFGKFINKPIIIVSAGPSLDKNIDYLKDAGEEVFIFSTGRSLKALLSKDIRVDMFCIIDAQDEATYKQIEGVENKDIRLVFLNTASFDTVNKYQGPKYIAYSQDYDETQKGRIESGGSVATAMLDLAIKFGGNPIIFVGQDLAYTNGMTHSKDARSRQVLELPNMRKVKGIEGNYIATTPVLLSYKHWIENKIQKNKNIHFINATEGGAYIEGCKHCSLIDVLKDNK